jgi:hypothetical protein
MNRRFGILVNTKVPLQILLIDDFDYVLNDVRISKSRTAGVGSEGKGRPNRIMPTDSVSLYS